MDEIYIRWLKNLKKGDQVVISSGHMITFCYVIAYVEKITTGGAIKVNGVLYNSVTGRAKGDHDYSQSLSMPTTEILNEIEFKKLNDEVSRLDPDLLNIEEMRGLYNYIKDNKLIKPKIER